MRRRAHCCGATWRALLEGQPHDTLCGTSVDAVARAQDVRHADVAARADALRDDAIASLLDHDVERARREQSEWRPAVVLRNRAPRAPRGGVVELRLAGDAGRRRRRTGIRDTPGRTPPTPPRGRSTECRCSCSVGESASRSPSRRATTPMRTVSPKRAPSAGSASCRATRSRRACSAAAGRRRWRSRRFRYASRARRSTTACCASRSRDDGARRAARSRSPVERSSVSSCSRTRPTSAICTRRRSAMRAGVRGAARARRCTAVRCAARSLWTGECPHGRAERRRADVRSHWCSTRRQRSCASASMAATRAPDHRLRLLLAHRAAAPRPRSPTPRSISSSGGHSSRHPTTMRWSTSYRPRHCIAMCRATAPMRVRRSSRTVSPNTRRSPTARVAVTLVRAVGELSRHDLPERPGHAGWPRRHSAGAVDRPVSRRARARAARPATRRRSATPIERMADDVLLPTRRTRRSDRTSRAAPVAGGLELEGDGLAFSAAMPAREPGWIVLRCVNRARQRRARPLALATADRRGPLARLDETPLEPLAVGDDACVSSPRRRTRSSRCSCAGRVALGSDRGAALARQPVAPRVAEHRRREHRDDERDARARARPTARRRAGRDRRRSCSPSSARAAGCRARGTKARSRAGSRCRRRASSPRAPARSRSAARAAQSTRSWRRAERLRGGHVRPLAHRRTSARTSRATPIHPVSTSTTRIVRDARLPERDADQQQHEPRSASRMSATAVIARSDDARPPAGDRTEQRAHRAATVRRRSRRRAARAGPRASCARTDRARTGRCRADATRRARRARTAARGVARARPG